MQDDTISVATCLNIDFLNCFSQFQKSIPDFPVQKSGQPRHFQLHSAKQMGATLKENGGLHSKEGRYFLKYEDTVSTLSFFTDSVNQHGIITNIPICSTCVFV